MIQGLAVLAMVVLHLFDRLEYTDLYKPLLHFMGRPVIFYFAQLSDFCVMGFAFCSGYGLYKNYKESNSDEQYMKTRLKSLWILLVNYWIILIGFTIISVLVGNADNMPGSFKEFLGNFTTVNVTYNGAWWYLFIYIVLVLVSPILFKCCDNIPLVPLSIISVLFYISAYYVRFHMSNVGWLLGKYGVFGMTLFEFLVGVICCKQKWISRTKMIVYKIPRIYRVIGALIILVGLLIGHTLIIPSLLIAPATGLMIIFGFSLWNKPQWICNIFEFLGKHSTNIWLIHMFFYLYIFKELVFMLHYPLLILGEMLALCIICSFIVNGIIKFIRPVLK